MPRPKTWAIYREPGGQALRERERRSRTYGLYLSPPSPRRMAVIEADSEVEALEAFARAEQIRSRQVADWDIIRLRGRPCLVVKLVNGANQHAARYYASR